MEHGKKHALYLLPEAVRHVLEVRLLGQRCKILLSGNTEVTAILPKSQLRNAPAHVHVCCFIHIPQERVEVLAKQLPQTVVRNGLMQQRMNSVLDVGMVRDDNSYLARLRIKETLGMMHLAPALLHLHGLGHNLNVVKMQPLCQLPHSIRHITALTGCKGLALLGRARLLAQHLHKRVVHFAQLIIRIGTIALTGKIFIFLDSMIQIIQYLCNVSLGECRLTAGS